MNMSFYSKRFRLRTDILFSLVFLMVFFMFAINIVVLKFSRDFMIDRLKNEHERYSKEIQQGFGQSMSSGLLKDDKKAFEYLSSMYLLPRDASIGVYRVDGKAGKNVLVRGEDLTQGDERIVSCSKKEMPFVSLNFSRLFIFSKLLSIETCIPLSAPGRSYAVFLRSGQNFEEEGFRKIKLLIILYTCLSAAVVVVFGYVMFSRSVIKPLERISSLASEISNGNLDVVIDYPMKNEIGELAESLRKMTEKLISNQKELEENLASVQNLNNALKEAQAEMLRFEKLASIGRLSSGMAHEIGNPLSAVIGYIGILKKESSPESVELLSRAEGELLRISRIIRQLLDFSRQEPLEMRPVDINLCLSEVLENLKVVGKLDNIKVTVDSSVTGISQMDEQKMRQVMINLLNNATDAVKEKYGGEGGSIRINLSLGSVNDMEELKTAFLFTAGRRKDDPPERIFLGSRLRKRKEDPPKSRPYEKRGRDSLNLPKFLFNEDERLLKMTVEDNGLGIRPEDMHKIFDPFYTTKEPGAGTGLGLYMTLNFVDAMGGYIDFISEKGKGTMFIVIMQAGSFC